MREALNGDKLHNGYKSNAFEIQFIPYKVTKRLKVL